MRHFFFIVVFITATLTIANAALNCSVCQLGSSYTESNGYGCFEIAADKIACTCPDRRYKLNEPCRICQRSNICGNDPKSLCAETSSKSLENKTTNSQYYACFCADTTFEIDAPCPSIPLATTTTTAPPVNPE